MEEFEQSKDRFSKAASYFIEEKLNGFEIISNQEGFDNHAFMLSNGKDSLFLRISKSDKKFIFESEIWAENQARNAQFPSPKTIDSGNFTFNNLEYVYCIQEKVLGKQLSTEIESLSKQDKSFIELQIGRLLRNLHEVSVAGFDKADKEITFPFTNLIDYSRAIHFSRSKDLKNLRDSGFVSKPEVYELILEEILNLPKMYEANLKPHLVHFDIKPEHVFINDDLVITSFIDFGNWRGGFNDLEFAWIGTRDEFDLEHILKGYCFNDNDQTRRRLELTKAIYLFGYLNDKRFDTKKRQSYKQQFELIAESLFR